MSDKTCKTCKMWRRGHFGDSGVCHRFPCVAIRKPSDWCGEWLKARVTDEQTLLAGNTPAFVVTDLENGTSVTEPAPERALLKENELLRELVRELWQLYVDSNDLLDREQMRREMQVRDHLREVGIDVDAEQTNDDKGELE